METTKKTIWIDANNQANIEISPMTDTRSGKKIVFTFEKDKPITLSGYQMEGTCTILYCDAGVRHVEVDVFLSPGDKRAPSWATLNVKDTCIKVVDKLNSISGDTVKLQKKPSEVYGVRSVMDGETRTIPIEEFRDELESDLINYAMELDDCEDESLNKALDCSSKAFKKIPAHQLVYIRKAFELALIGVSYEHEVVDID